MNSVFVLIGISIGIIVYIFVVRPLAASSCLVDTRNCIALEYQTLGNTALIYDKASDRHIWFVGDDILLYGEPTGRLCDEDGDYEPAYVWNMSSNTAKGYTCSFPIRKVKEMYYKLERTNVLNIKTIGTLDMYGMVNALIDKGVISIPEGKKDAQEG